MYQEILAFDSARDIRAIASVDRAITSDDSADAVPANRRGMWRKDTGALDQATLSAMARASAAYSQMLVALDARRMRLQATREDIASCTSLVELHASLALALEAGIPFTVLSECYHSAWYRLSRLSRVPMV